MNEARSDRNMDPFIMVLEAPTEDDSNTAELVLSDESSSSSSDSYMSPTASIRYTKC